MTNESEERDTWSKLVENLGVEPVAEDRQPQPAVPTPSTKPASERPRKPAPPRPAGDWSQLAGMLGIELPPDEPPAEPPPKPAPPPVAKVERVAPQPPVVEHFVERTVVEKIETFAPRESSDEPLEVIEEPVVSIGWSSEQRAEELAVSEPEARLEDLPGYVEPPALLDDSDTIEEMLSYRDAGQAEMDGDDFASEPAVRRRRRRRGGRRRDSDSADVTGPTDATGSAGAAATESESAETRPFERRPVATGPQAERLPKAEREPQAEREIEPGLEADKEHAFGRLSESDADSDSGSDAGSDERVDTDAEDAGGEPSVRRRRRRRRRRGGGGGGGEDRGGEDRESPGTQKGRRDGKAADAVESLGAAPELDDDDSGSDDDDFADAGSADDEAADDSGAGRHRKIPTWAEAVTVVIDANMQSRSKSGGNSRGGEPRGRRRGRR